VEPLFRKEKISTPFEIEFDLHLVSLFRLRVKYISIYVCVYTRVAADRLLCSVHTLLLCVLPVNMSTQFAARQTKTKTSSSSIWLWRCAGHRDAFGRRYSTQILLGLSPWHTQGWRAREIRFLFSHDSLRRKDISQIRTIQNFPRVVPWTVMVGRTYLSLYGLWYDVGFPLRPFLFIYFFFAF